MSAKASKKGAAVSSGTMQLPEPRDFIPKLIRAHSSLLNSFEKVCGLHMARWRLLYNLARVGRASQNELSRSTTMGPAAVTRILADMERQKLIFRKQSEEDSRRIIVELTPEGEALVARTAEKREDFIRLALDGLSDAEVVLLERLLSEIDSNLASVR